MAKEQFIIADEDVAIALNPEQDIISIDENGNFVEEDGFGGKTYYQRDTKNPNLLHVYDSDGKLTGNVSLSVTPERGVALHSSSLNTENTSDRIVNPDGSYQDSYNVGKNGEIKTIKKDTEGNTITEYSHLDDSGNSHIDHVVERRADGSVSFQNFPQEECTDEEWDKIAAAWKDSEDDGLKFLDFGSSFFPLDFSKRKPTDNEDDEEEDDDDEEDDDETEDEEIEESTPKSLFTDKEVAFALDPKEGNVIVDKDGNFYNKSTSITYKRDPKNPDILHTHNPRNGKQKETITLKESKEGAILLQSSTGLKRTINPDLSFQEQFQAGTIKKPFNIDSENPRAYFHEEINSYDKKGTCTKNYFKFWDGSVVEISVQKYLYRRPDGTVRYCKLVEPDGTSISVEQDKDAKMAEWTFCDKDRKPLLKVKETQKSIQYLKMGTDKKWHVLPGITDSFDKLGTASLDKLKKMTPEEVDKVLKGRGQKVTPTPAPKEQLPLPPVFDMVKPIYEAENYHSLTNNVSRVVNTTHR